MKLNNISFSDLSVQKSTLSTNCSGLNTGCKSKAIFSIPNMHEITHLSDWEEKCRVQNFYLKQIKGEILMLCVDCKDYTKQLSQNEMILSCYLSIDKRLCNNGSFQFNLNTILVTGSFYDTMMTLLIDRGFSQVLYNAEAKQFTCGPCFEKSSDVSDLDWRYMEFV